MKNISITLIFQLLSSAVFCQSWNTHEPSSLGSAQGNYQQIRQTSGNAIGNNIYSNLWLLRKESGTGWVLTCLRWQ